MSNDEGIEPYFYSTLKTLLTGKRWLISNWLISSVQYSNIVNDGVSSCYFITIFERDESLTTVSGMKAFVCTKYGSPEVLQLREIEKPVPRDNQVLIKICASTVTMGDCEIRTLTLPMWTQFPLRLIFGYRKPRRYIPGMEISGIIESVGKNVTSLKVGDAVFGSSGIMMGGNAEYICRPANVLAIKPANVSFGEAATIMVGGINAFHFLKKARIQPGQKVLIIGAGGSIGTYGVLLAKLFGAEVTAVDSTLKLDVLRSLGADHVIDYTKENFSENNVKYDVILDTVYQSSFSQCVNALKPEGYYLMANTDPIRMLRGSWVARTTKRKMIFALAAETLEDMNHLAHLIASSKIRPFIDKTYPFEKVAEAHGYVEGGFKKGCVVITHVP
jgi:NADPH:quinone reductase-like Zn-dependent oxidoreductase